MQPALALMVISLTKPLPGLDRRAGQRWFGQSVNHIETQ